MLYNKNKVSKANDKKVLHKVGKQWKVVSVALLMAVAGGAVATHAANADSTNNSALYNEISAPVALQTAPQSAAPSSVASNTSASAKPASAVSYVKDDQGNLTSGASAASYSAKAANDKAVVNAYVQSVNSKFALEATPVNSVVSSAQAAAKSDMALANSYSATANDKGAQSVAASVASKAGFDLNDYVNFVKPQASNFNSAVKSAADFNSALGLVNGLAQSLAFVGDFNFSSASNQAFMSSLNASAAAQIAAYKTNFNAGNSSVAADHNAQNAKVNAAALLNSVATSEDAYEKAVEATVLSANTSASSDLTSFANNNSSLVSSAVSSYAASNSNATEYSFSGVSSKLTTGSAFNYMKKLVANSAALSADASLTAKFNSVLASTAAAKNSLSVANSSYTAASNSASDALTQVNAASAAASLASLALNSASSMAKNKQAFAQSLVSAVAAGKDAVEDLFGVEAYNGLSTKEKLFAKSDLASMASANGLNVASLANDANNASAVKSVATDFKVALGNNYSNSNVSSVANSLAAAGQKAYASASVSASSFAASTAEDYTLASYFASSYSTDASSENNVASEAMSGLAAFANANGLNNSAYSAALAAEPNDESFAKAWGTAVWNNTPKYVTVLKNGLLHADVNYGSKDDKVLAGVNKGDQLTVTGVGIAANGLLRLKTTLSNGKTGYFTYYYAKPTYLSALKGNKGDYTVTKVARVYKDAKRTEKTNKFVGVGQALNDATVLSLDNQFGGYSVLELSDGTYVTANTNWVVPANATTPAKGNNTNNSKPVNHVFFK